MIDTAKLIEIIKENGSVSDYEMTWSQSDERQLYYVGKALETNRAVKKESLNVMLYVDEGQERGSSSFVVNVFDDENSIKEKVEETVKRASAAKNKWYPLTENTESVENAVSEEIDLNAEALKIADAIFDADNKDGSGLNATEIFVTKAKHHFLNSKGVSHSYDKLRAEFETIPSAEGEHESVEVYNYTSLREVDSAKITTDVKNLLGFAELRAKAVKASEVEIPSGVPVVIRSDVAGELAMTITNDMSYAAHYQKFNHFEVGDKIACENLNITLTGDGEDAYGLGPIDSHGNVLHEKEIVRDGLVTALWGSNRFAHYMGEEATGDFNRVVVRAKGDDAYKTEKHILVYSFSSPQIDWEVGYIGGEVRLALYFNGEGYIPITGFSVSGNVFEILGDMGFSKCTEDYMDSRISYSGPKYWILPKMSIN